MQQAFGRLAPTRAYEVRLSRQGNLYWLERQGGREVRHDTEPNTTAWQRALVHLLALLEMDWLLFTVLFCGGAAAACRFRPATGRVPAPANREAANDKADESADNGGRGGWHVGQMPDHHERRRGERCDGVQIAFEHGRRARNEKVAGNSAADAGYHTEQGCRRCGSIRRRAPFPCRKRQRKTGRPRQRRGLGPRSFDTGDDQKKVRMPATMATVK